jgi:MtfA peptidase
MLAFLRERQRQRLREQPFPTAWETYLETNVPYLALLTEEERHRLRGDIQVFVAEKYWEGCNGLTLTDEMRVTVAAYACLLQLNQERRDYYPNVQSILIYPSAYRVKHQKQKGAGVIWEGMETRSGEAWSSDWPVVLSWDETLQGGRNPEDGHNVVLHEFAHKLDMLKAPVDGVPDLKDQASFDQWAEVMSAEYATLVQDTESGFQGLIDPYGATSPAEFFAVVTETFFEKPRELADEHPRLYAIFRTFYRQDPAARMEERSPIPP